MDKVEITKEEWQAGEIASLREALAKTEQDLSAAHQQIGAAAKGASARAGGWPIGTQHGYAGENANAWKFGWGWCNDCLADPEFLQPGSAEARVTWQAGEIERRKRATAAESARDAALREAADWATKCGEAQGKLSTSETAGVVQGWKERAEAAEGKLAAIEARLAKFRPLRYMNPEEQELTSDLAAILHPKASTP